MVPKSGHVTITKIENLHRRRKIHRFQKCYSFRSTTKNNEKLFQNGGVTRRLWTLGRHEYWRSSSIHRPTRVPRWANDSYERFCSWKSRLILLVNVLQLQQTICTVVKTFTCSIKEINLSAVAKHFKNLSLPFSKISLHCYLRKGWRCVLTSPVCETACPSAGHLKKLSNFDDIFSSMCDWQQVISVWCWSESRGGYRNFKLNNCYHCRIWAKYEFCR